MTDDALVIDWEAKFHKAISQGIREKSGVKRQLRDTQLLLDQANSTIREQAEEIARLKPAGDKLAGVVADARKAEDQYVARIRALQLRVNKLVDERKQGQRVVIGDLITYLEDTARKLPAPVAVPEAVDMISTAAKPH